MNEVISVCIVIITVVLVVLIGAMIFILIEVRKLSKMAEKLMMQLEKGFNPVLSGLNKVSNDLAFVTDTVRSQVQRIDLTAAHISKSLITLVETCTKTGFILHDAVAEPLIDIAALIKGFSRGVKFFLTNRK